jgi:hypothetical protein
MMKDKPALKCIESIPIDVRRKSDSAKKCIANVGETYRGEILLPESGTVCTTSATFR